MGIACNRVRVGFHRDRNSQTADSYAHVWTWTPRQHSRLSRHKFIPNGHDRGAYPMCQSANGQHVAQVSVARHRQGYLQTRTEGTKVTFVHPILLARLVAASLFVGGSLMVIYACSRWTESSTEYLIAGVVLTLCAIFGWTATPSIRIRSGKIAFYVGCQKMYSRETAEVVQVTDLEDWSVWSAGGLGWRRLAPGTFAYAVGGKSAIRISFQGGDSVVIHARDVASVAEHLRASR